VQAAQARDEKETIDLRLIFRRKKTGEILLDVGGRWETHAKCYIDTPADPALAHIVWINEAQLQVVARFRIWLEARLAGKVRRLILYAGGKRGGGKSWIMTALLCAAAIAIPGAIVFMVSPNLDKRDEIERYVRVSTPGPWRTYLERKLQFTLINGSILKNVSGDVATAVKRGDAEIVFLNDAQDMSKTVYSLGLGALRTGGFMLVAANPPETLRAEWVGKLKEKIEEKAIDGDFVEVDPDQNENVDQVTLGQIAEAIRAIDPRAAAANSDGLWLPVGERAYDHFSKRNLVELSDITHADVTAAFMKKRAYRPFPQAGGVDFNGAPHHAGVIAKLFGALEEPTVHVIDEVFAEQAFEDDFLDEVDELGYRPEDLHWTGDASGQWQDGKHSHSGGGASFDIFKRRRWRIGPPVVKKTERGEFSKNPKINDRLALVNKFLGTGRLLIDPKRCPRLAVALKECPLAVGKFDVKKPYGVYSHVTDALGYLIYYLFPPKRGNVAPPKRGALVAVDTGPQGLRIL
jgi:hypothetical protein